MLNGKWISYVMKVRYFIHLKGECSHLSPKGDKYWSKNGLCHRIGLPAIDGAPDGYKVWCVSGMFHNLYGPAITLGDYKAWYVNGSLHNRYGPAIEYSDGYASYYINGACVPSKDFKIGT